jgi:hypothetical protein
MAAYQIICVEKEHPHRHITAVGIGVETRQAPTKLNVQQVRAAIRSGDRFYTVSPSTGKTADVLPDDVPVNGRIIETIRSTPDAVSDNNLDNMRACA